MSKTPRHLFLLTSSGWGGLEMNVIQLGTWLRSHEYDIQIASNSEARFTSKAQESGFITHNFQTSKKYFDFAAAKRLANVITSNGYTHLWVFDNKDLDVASICKRRHVKDLKLIYQQHMQIGINKKSPIHSRRYKMIDAWISPLRWLKAEVMEKTRFPAERIHVIPLGLDLDRFTKATVTQQEARRLLNLPEEKVLIGVIGRIDPGKGQVFILESLLSLAGKLDFELVFVGEPTINDPSCLAYNKKLRDTAKEQHELRVHFISSVDDAKVFFTAINLFVLGSIGETYGMVTLEALACNTPVIATNSGGTPEILGDGKWGQLYEPNSSDSLRSAVKKWFDSKETRTSTIDYIREQFDYQLEIKAIENLIRSL